jgi:hypothetical protein
MRRTPITLKQACFEQAVKDAAELTPVVATMAATLYAQHLTAGQSPESAMEAATTDALKLYKVVSNRLLRAAIENLKQD